MGKGGPPAKGKGREWGGPNPPSPSYRPFADAPQGRGRLPAEGQGPRPGRTFPVESTQGLCRAAVLAAPLAEATGGEPDSRFGIQPCLSRLSSRLRWDYCGTGRAPKQASKRAPTAGRGQEGLLWGEVNTKDTKATKGRAGRNATDGGQGGQAKNEIASLRRQDCTAVRARNDGGGRRRECGEAGFGEEGLNTKDTKGTKGRAGRDGREGKAELASRAVRHERRRPRE
jgi:hypothetical protein